MKPGLAFCEKVGSASNVAMFLSYKAYGEVRARTTALPLYRRMVTSPSTIVLALATNASRSVRSGSYHSPS